MRKIAIMFMSILMLSMFLVCSVAAPDCGLTLPTTPVTMVVQDDTTSTFDITLSNVPAGYGVTNGVYPGWCIDTGHAMRRGENINVMLYSSCNPPTGLTPPIDIYEWDKVNYILNNKPSTATVLEIQQAIWYYVNWAEPSYTPSLPGAQAIVSDAEANGDNFVPGLGQIAAVICYPVTPDNPWNNQLAIIEVEVPGEAGFTPGFWKHNIGVYLGLNKGKYSAFEGGPLDGIKVNAIMLEGFAATVKVSLQDAYDAVNAKGGPPNNMIRADMANAFNAAAGYGPFEDSD